MKIKNFNEENKKRSSIVVFLINYVRLRRLSMNIYHFFKKYIEIFKMIIDHTFSKFEA